jgi:hypothetical protein
MLNAGLAATLGCDVAGPNFAVVTAVCPAGAVMTGGGFEGHVILTTFPGDPVSAIPFDVGIISSRPFGNGWQASADVSDAGGTERLTAFAVCSPTS